MGIYQRGHCAVKYMVMTTCSVETCEIQDCINLISCNEGAATDIGGQVIQLVHTRDPIRGVQLKEITSSSSCEEVHGTACEFQIQNR
jgi:hypothetical protein